MYSFLVKGRTDIPVCQKIINVRQECLTHHDFFSGTN